LRAVSPSVHPIDYEIIMLLLCSHWLSILSHFSGNAPPAEPSIDFATGFGVLESGELRYPGSAYLNVQYHVDQAKLEDRYEGRDSDNILELLVSKG
jgi:hypothetical protein